MIDLTGQVALITGAGRGIGQGCAVALAQVGATIVINDRPGSPDLAATAADLATLGVPVHAVEADVFTRVGCELLLEQTKALTGQIDILVSNPARSTRAPFLDFKLEDFESTIQATLIGGFNMSQLAARAMVKQGQGGKIIFISSVHAERPYQTAVAYNAAKAGLNHMARTMARELVVHHINVNVIEPGWIGTPGEYENYSYERVQREGAKLPWGRLGTPADIGQAVAFLASSAADYITGSILAVDGGFRDKDT
ncbi:MAG: SDR family oxidoreductase [Ardenticatenaceae bacterium]|nr:SDR family oxidoreductase [Ardenticatenaceae bacterium]